MTPRVFLTRIKSTTQSASLNDLSAVPSPLCPHDSTPGEVAKVKLINVVTTVMFHLAMPNNNAISVGLLVVVLAHHH